MNSRVSELPDHRSADNQQLALLLARLFPLFWLIAKLIGWKLWLKERLFPLVPVASVFDYPSLLHYLLFVGSIVLLALCIYKPLNKPLLIALLLTEIMACLADQNRWQPWEYQYLFSILICLFNFGEPRKIPAGFAFLLAATYFYSGLGKLNEGYLVLVWDNIFLKHTFHLSAQTRMQSLVYNGGYITAVIEIILAIGLFLPRFQKAAAWGTILMHGLILYAIGPLGMKYNVIVWPWNVLMIIFLYLLFIRNSILDTDWRLLLSKWNVVVLLVWGIMPALNYFNLWDNYLSFRLYSGHLKQMGICLHNDADMETMKPFISPGNPYRLCDGKALVNIQIWAMKEMNVPPYPEMRIYRSIEKQWKEAHPDTSNRIVYYLPVLPQKARVLHP